MPFRENVLQYPPHSPLVTPTKKPTLVAPIRPPPPSNGASPAAKQKPISSSDAMKRRAAINAGQPMPPIPGQKPEDKPDSPEYKKKHVMLAGPILELTYENASSYGMEESTFTALKDIFMALIASPSRTGVLSPQRFLEIFKRDNEMFRTSMHQDAHEFYGLVLNAVISNVEANAQRMKELAPPPAEDGLVHSMNAAVTTAVNALGLSNGARSPGTGWVHDIFEGVLTSETKCLTCETASQRDETFLDLSIDLDEHSSVTSCLRKFSAEEMLCERNKFHCDNCGGLQEAEKRMKIKKLPKILALHLKRFKYTEDMTRLQKLFHRVVYPYYLRMFNTTDDAEDPDRLYELYAVVVHIGGNAYHGHYVSVIKTQDRGWLLFDDEMVEPVDKHYVRNFFGDKPGQACAYVLFYQETTVEAMRKEQEAEGLAEVALASEISNIVFEQPKTNGTHPASVSKAVSIPSTPVEEKHEFVSLGHAITAPIPPSPGFATLAPPVPPMPATLETPTKTKEDREREKKESKEAEKSKKVAEKAAEKDRIKAEERKRKDIEIARREMHKTQAEEMKKALAISKQSATEDEGKRKSDSPFAPVNYNSETSAISDSNSPNPEKPAHDGKFAALSRGHRGSKSMSRKSFSFLSGKTHNGTPPTLPPSLPPVDDNEHMAVDSAGNGNGSGVGNGLPPSTPTADKQEKHEKLKKERFGFGGLGRKKSNLFSV